MTGPAPRADRERAEIAAYLRACHDFTETAWPTPGAERRALEGIDRILTGIGWRFIAGVAVSPGGAVWAVDEAEPEKIDPASLPETERAELAAAGVVARAPAPKRRVSPRQARKAGRLLSLAVQALDASATALRRTEHADATKLARLLEGLVGDVVDVSGELADLLGMLEFAAVAARLEGVEHG